MGFKHPLLFLEELQSGVERSVVEAETGIRRVNQDGAELGVDLLKIECRIAIVALIVSQLNQES